MGSKKKEQKEKPIEKMTVKELRELALEIPEITGVHGKNKDELIADIKEARGIVDDEPRKAKRSVQELKKKIKDLKQKREEALGADDRKMAQIFRRRISRLKKKTRKAA